MEAGITDHIWGLEELVGLATEVEAAKFQNRFILKNHSREEAAISRISRERINRGF